MQRFKKPCYDACQMLSIIAIICLYCLVTCTSVFIESVLFHIVLQDYCSGMRSCSAPCDTPAGSLMNLLQKCPLCLGQMVPLPSSS